MKRLNYVGAAISLVLIGACTHRSVPADPSEGIANALVGTWDNRAQFATAPEALKIPPSVNGDWLDIQDAAFVRVNAPQLGAQVLYLEWKTAAGVISRQRIWSFRTDKEGVTRMDFYAFVDGKAWAGKVSRDDALSAFRDLTTDALRGYGDNCALKFNLDAKSFRGEITSRECSITAASGRRMGINASVEMRADGVLEYRESGQLEDGRYAFRVPPSMPYQFVRKPNT